MENTATQLLLIGAVLGLFALVVLNGGYRWLMRTLALRKEVRRLADLCFELSDRGSAMVVEFPDEVKAIEAAVATNDVRLLRAYANLIYEVRTPLINVVVVNVLHAHANNRHESLTPESLTTEQVSVFHEVYGLVDPLEISGLAMDKQRNRIALFAIDNITDAPLIISIVKRGIDSLPEVKAMLSEMKTLPAAALAEGVL